MAQSGGPAGVHLLAAIIVGILLLATGHNPISTYHQMYSASVTADGALTSTFVYADAVAVHRLCAPRSPSGCAPGTSVARDSSTWVPWGPPPSGSCSADWPRPLLIIAMVLGGFAAGTVWATIPALFRAYLRTNEILTSLMLNYVAGFSHVLPDLRQRLVLA